jgi:hypothetical protein
MTRITSTILVFLIIINGATTVMVGSGFADDIGVSPGPASQDEINQSIADAKQGFNPSGGGLSTLFGLFVSAMSLFEELFQVAFAAPAMFMNMGFPSWIVTPFFAPLYLVSTLELVYVATGRDMV